MTLQEKFQLLLGKGKPGGLAPGFRERHIEYIVVAVNGIAPELIAANIAKVVDLATGYDAYIETLFGPIVIMAYGIFPERAKAGHDRTTLIAALEQELGPRIKIVHGASDGYFGLIGGQQRLAYSFLIPDFPGALAKLAEISFGDTVEHGTKA